MSHQDAAKVMTERAGLEPRVGIVLGSGLGAVADAVADPTVVDYGELPGFPRPTVEGHGGRAVLGRIGEVPVAVLQGRAHVYEGGVPRSVEFDTVVPEGLPALPDTPRKLSPVQPRFLTALAEAARTATAWRSPGW